MHLNSPGATPAPARLRFFDTADLDSLCELDAACFPPRIAYSRDELATFIGERGSRTWVAEANGEIAGFLVANGGWGGILRIITIDVRASFRRQGVGSMLMDAAESWARSKKLRVISLETSETNYAAQAFYFSRGYIKLKRVARYYADGAAAWVMVKRLEG